MSGLEELRGEVQALRAELHHQRRRTRALGGTLALAAGLFLLAGAKEPATVLQADRIEIGEGTPGIVLEEGADGPRITLSTGDGRTTRLSMAGLEITQAAAEPAEVPTIEDPGLGEIPVQDGPPVVVHVPEADYVTHLEVACTNGFRNRARFVEGQAVMHLPHEARDCVGTLGGGTVMTRFALRAGDELVCERFRTGATLSCQQARQPR
ncbi:MAG: hypothetical protein H6737_02735 [Alphaproteobacteria bacterium]|nr:hypothetical protein [Alphaproteobacteria bacterium]